jgi:hypothetical protein
VDYPRRDYDGIAIAFVERATQLMGKQTMNNAFVAFVGAFVTSTMFASIANANLIITGLTATATIGPPTNVLGATVTSISNPDALPGTLQIEVSATTFSPAVSDILTAASGSFVNATGSTITFNWYIDRGNVLLGKTELIDSFSFTAPDAAESFSHDFMLDLLNDISSPYSMTLQMNITLGAQGALTDVSQAETSPVLQASEPASLALLGLGLAGLTAIRRKRS